MALDPSISLGVRPMELANPLAQYGQIAQIQNAQNQNSLAQYQLGAAQRAEAKDVARTNMLAQAGTDDTAIANALLKSGDLKGYSDFVKSRRDTQKADVELADAKLKQSRAFLDTINPADPDAPSQYIAWHEANHKDPVLGPLLAARGVTADQARSRINRAIQSGPQAFAELLNQSKLGTEKFMELNKPTTTVGPTGIVQTPGLGGPAKIVQGTDEAFQMTPAQIAQNRIAQGQLGVAQGRLELERENANKPVFNAQAGGFIAPISKENPEGKFIPASGIQAAKDQQAAVKALKSAGYDPITGEDAISKLIAKSTSGGLQAGSAATLAFFGKSTEGRKAISALEGTANQIATDLAGGKLGAGISNTDREFIVAALGDVANPMKPAGDRLAGWNAAKERMMRAGLIPPPKGAEAAATPSASPNVVVTPDGQSHTFPNAAAAAQFKKAAGL